MIGRKREIQVLQEAYASENSEFVAVYGRRRVGKTFLINEMFGNRYAFQHAGVEKASMREQLGYFRDSLSRYGDSETRRLSDWREAFFRLSQLLEGSSVERKVIFIDEAPWLDTPKSGFLSALEQFWNGWACLRKDIVLVICGSATAWVVNEVLRNRGGLHNRVTRPLAVDPFTLGECEEYARWKNLPFDRQSIVECYMALGGVAYYWSLLASNLSVAQNMDALFFAKNALLKNEFDRLFASLFRHERKYVEIVKILAARGSGQTRDEILRQMPSPCGGEISRYLQELEECGFVLRTNVFGMKKKGSVYRLLDCFVLFYLGFLLPLRSHDERFWEISCDKPVLSAWRGIAFERVCFVHREQIRAALGIAGVLTDFYSWRAKSDAESSVADAQVDMVIDRGDRIVNLCEIKYAQKEYSVSGDEAMRLRRRVESFREGTGTRKGIVLTMVAPFGVKRDAHSAAVQSVVTLDDLFRR